MTKKLSPVELKPIVLAVLGTLLSTPADAVTIDALVTNVCTHLDIKEDAWGVVESQKAKPTWARYNIIRSFRYLKEDGHGIPKGRGLYGLTLEGLEMAKAEEPLVVEESPKTDNPNTGVSYLFGDIPEDTYHSDESVREIAISKTDCFGYWAERSPTCKICPLAGSCKRDAFLAFVEIAEALDVLENTPEPVVEEEPKAEEPKVEEPKVEKVSDGEPNPAHIIPAPCEMVCDKCGKAIEAGEKAVWDVENGMMPIHLACF